MNAHEKRLELASQQRMQKTKDKWVDLANRLGDCFHKYTTHKGHSLGENIEFTKTTIKAKGYVNVSFREGVIFALGEKVILVVYRGKLEKVNYPDTKASGWV